MTTDDVFTLGFGVDDPPGDLVRLWWWAVGVNFGILTTGVVIGAVSAMIWR